MLITKYLFQCNFIKLETDQMTQSKFLLVQIHLVNNYLKTILQVIIAKIQVIMK